SVSGPGDFGESHPANLVGQILTRCGIPDVYRAPIRSPLGKPVSQKRSVVGRLPLRHGKTAVSRNHIRVDDELRRAVAAGTDVNGRLPLKTAVPGIKISRSPAYRDRDLRVVPEFGNALPEVLAQR